jgi:fucose permease
VASVLLLGVLLAGMFFGLNVLLRRRGDERLYRRVTLTLIAIIFAIVGSVIVAIQLGFITDHYP